ITAWLYNIGTQLASYASIFAPINRKINVKSYSLFGPAYKGITLVASSSTVLAMKYNIDMTYGSERKVEKDHVEGGLFVGAVMISTKVFSIDYGLPAGKASY
ncbi:orotate phosphoribosyltransferase, partial [Francisella tularensis]|nr:orotate phosphoribosyltransferase [Francisella tularensis]